MSANPASQNYPLATLYVGDLDPDVTEAQLFERFSAAGPVLSIRVCRDQITKQSLGYAYVNFQQPADAERALDTMNFDLLNTRPMRIMWSQRDPALRKNGVGNVFIKNLDKLIDNKALYDTFSTFGNILSCKIMTDGEANSKGYGFVHFETQEAADKAIASVNNMLLNNKKVFVGQFLSKNERNEATGGPYRKFTNVFVKNFGEQLDDEKLKELFEKYGEITSAVVARDSEGRSKGFGFVNFKEAHCAEQAVRETNDMIIGDKKLLVGAFQKKTERLSDLKKKYEDEKRERLSKYSGVNLYIKNLDDKIDDERLRKEFQPFGTITSAKVMTEGGRSKGFGFVCFSAPEEATRAVTEMNSRIVGAKPLYVALAQRKEERRNHLTNQYMQRIANMRMQNQQLGQIYPGAAAAAGAQTAAGMSVGGNPNLAAAAAAANAAMFMPQLQNAARLYSTQPLYAHQQIRPQPRWAGPSGSGQRGGPNQGGNGQQYQTYQMMGPGGQGGQRARYQMNAAQQAQAQAQQQQQGGNQNPAAVAAAAAAAAAAAMIRPNNAAAVAAAANAARLNYGNPAMVNAAAYAQQMRQQMPQQQQQMNGQQQGQGANQASLMQQQQQRQQQQVPAQNKQATYANRVQQQGGSNQSAGNASSSQQQQAINVPGQEPLTTDMLAAAQPQEQKQLLGERLYPLIQNMHPEWAGKITGMLLEIDNAELLHMLDSRESLKEKVDEAVSVLKAHQVKQVQQLQAE